MQLAKTTPKILAYKVLNRTTDDEWVNWAIDMLRAGYDTEHLRILAGESAPYNQFYMIELTDRVLKELGIECTDREQILNDYVYYLICLGRDKKMEIMSVLSTLSDFCYEIINETGPFLFEFRQLYWAKQDLETSEQTWEWPGANRNNIDLIILSYFKKWAAEYEMENPRMS